ncbi:MAG: DUF2807 domain-containing protein [Litorimonas sp.]
MKNLVAATALSLLFSGTAFAHDREARDVVVDHDLSGFDSIEVMGVYELDVRIGEGFSVRTEATDKDAKRLDVEVDGSTLVLSTDTDKKRWNMRAEENRAILAVITLPRLESLEVVGVATGDLSGFDGGDVDVEVAGVAELELTGTCDRLDIEVAGVGEVDASGLRCTDVEATLGGVGNLSVYASESIEADSGGIGEIEVYGDPAERDVDDGFMSKVRFRS